MVHVDEGANVDLVSRLEHSAHTALYNVLNVFQIPLMPVASRTSVRVPSPRYFSSARPSILHFFDSSIFTNPILSG